MNEPLTPDDFRPHLHRPLRVKGGHHALTLTEIELPALSEVQSGILPRQPFTLIFSGPPGDVLPAGMYELEAEDGSSYLLYIMPVHTPSRERQDYQAVFN